MSNTINKTKYNSVMVNEMRQVFTKTMCAEQF